MQVNVPAVVAITIGSEKKGWTFNVDVDLAAMPDNSLSHLFMYGLKQNLNDATAPTKTKAEAQEAVEKRLANLIAGRLRAGRESDPVMKEAKRILAIAVDKKHGKRTDDNKAVWDQTFLDTQKAEVWEAIMKKAEANVAALADIEI